MTPNSPTGQIKHIVFFIKENRTFDDYFGTYPGANGATMATDSSGQVVPLHHQADQVPDIDHSSEGARMAWDIGKMDKFDLLHSNGTKGANAPYANNSLTQLYQSNIPDYTQFEFSSMLRFAEDELQRVKHPTVDFLAKMLRGELLVPWASR